MGSLQDLVDFIKNNPSANNHWFEDEWEKHLTKAIPNWRTIVKTPNNWNIVERARPLHCYEYLCRLFLNTIGVVLVNQWFKSKFDVRRKMVRWWLQHMDNLDHDVWGQLNDEIKEYVIYYYFDANPGEPFKIMADMAKAISYLAHKGDFRRLPIKVTPSLFPIAGYVPSGEVSRLRSIVKRTGDEKHLKLIDGMIAQRENACQVSQRLVSQRIPYTPTRDERELIARLMEKPIKSGYIPTALPPIYISSETPPIFIAYPELEEEEDYKDESEECRIPRNSNRKKTKIITIEELLGVYQPQHQQIIIYERGIKWRRNRFEEKWLFSVVLIHEISHWITHLLPKPGTPTWSTDMYILGETDVHEGWAQLMTWWIADEVGGKFKSTFEELNQNQSPPYRVFEGFKNEPIDKVMESLEKLRLLSWPA